MPLSIRNIILLPKSSQATSAVITDLRQTRPDGKRFSWNLRTLSHRSHVETFPHPWRSHDIRGFGCPNVQVLWALTTGHTCGCRPPVQAWGCGRTQHNQIAYKADRKTQLDVLSHFIASSVSIRAWHSTVSLVIIRSTFSLYETKPLSWNILNFFFFEHHSLFRPGEQIGMEDMNLLRADAGRSGLCTIHCNLYYSNHCDCWFLLIMMALLWIFFYFCAWA